jgi:DNA-binding MarR family transcriptional regulator
MTDFNYDLLEHPYSIQVLLNLKDHFPMKLMDLQKEIKANRSTLERRIDELEGAGMVKIEIIRNMKRRVRISLTPFGRDVAIRLAEIERLSKQYLFS